jgi:hypothetical protein
VRAASPLSAQLCIRLRLPSSAHRATHSICRAIDPTSSTSTYITFTAAELAGDGAREERAASDRVMDGAGASTVEPPTKPIAAQPVEPTAPPSPRRRRKKKVTCDTSVPAATLHVLPTSWVITTAWHSMQWPGMWAMPSTNFSTSDPGDGVAGTVGQRAAVERVHARHEPHAAAGRGRKRHGGDAGRRARQGAAAARAGVCSYVVDTGLIRRRLLRRRSLQEVSRSVGTRRPLYLTATTPRCPSCW